MTAQRLQQFDLPDWWLFLLEDHRQGWEDRALFAL